jgi:hypothetical protein
MTHAALALPFIIDYLEGVDPERIVRCVSPCPGTRRNSGTVAPL